MECAKLRDDTLDVLYGEADPEAYRRVHEHLLACEDCREEMASLRRLRRTLGEWHVPQPSTPRSRSMSWPALGLAAAAALLLCVGAAFGLSGSELRFEEGRFAFRLGRGPDVERLAEQQAAQQEQIRSVQAKMEQPDPVWERDLLRHVEVLVRASESRQTLLLGTSLAELSEETRAQRRYDLARVAASLSYLEGSQGQQLARTSELMGYMLQASEKR
jgi:hypothetical protein